MVCVVNMFKKWVGHGLCLPYSGTYAIHMKVATCNGQAMVKVLPDSGADICATGPDLVHTLNESMNNLAESEITP